MDFPDLLDVPLELPVVCALRNGVQNGVEAFLPALHISGHKGLISHYLPKGFHK